MTSDPKVQERIRQYLLGQLTDDARAELEQELLANDEMFEEVLAAEDELIDEYLAGELSADARIQFEQHFLVTPEREQKLRFARALHRRVKTYSAQEKLIKDTFETSRTAGQGWLLRAMAGVGIVAVLAGALWLYFGRTTSPQTFATITLSISSNNRGDGVQAARVKLPLGTDALKISLKLPDASGPAIRYRVEITDANGASKTIPIVAQDSQSVFVVIPEKELRAGSYALKLFATSADNTERRIAGSYFVDVE